MIWRHSGDEDLSSLRKCHSGQHLIKLKDDKKPDLHTGFRAGSNSDLSHEDESSVEDHQQTVLVVLQQNPEGTEWERQMNKF